jgi:hypothetical protein
MKMCVHVPFFYKEDRLQYLTNLIDEYNNFDIHVDIFIHSNKSLDLRKLVGYSNGNLKVIKHSLFNYLLYKDRNYYLTWQPRKLMKKQVNEYDYFLYSEDDILVPLKAFKYWLENNNICSSINATVGFLRVETKDGEEYLSDITSSIGSKLELKSKKFAINNISPYCAFWIYDKKQMSEWVNKKTYNLKYVHGIGEKKSRLLESLGLKRVNWLQYLLYNRRHKRVDTAMEMSAYGMNFPNNNNFKYTLLELKNNKVIDDCKVYHLPNNYVNEKKTPMATLNFKNIYIH